MKPWPANSLFWVLFWTSPYLVVGCSSATDTKAVAQASEVLQTKSETKDPPETDDLEDEDQNSDQVDDPINDTQILGARFIPVEIGSIPYSAGSYACGEGVSIEDRMEIDVGLSSYFNIEISILHNGMQTDQINDQLRVEIKLKNNLSGSSLGGVHSIWPYTLFGEDEDGCLANNLMFDSELGPSELQIKVRDTDSDLLLAARTFRLLLFATPNYPADSF